MKICVYASSSDNIDKIYFEKTAQLGKSMLQGGHSLVYGAGNVGLMGEIARNMIGAEIIGVIPKRLDIKGITFEQCTQLIVTKDMRERKHVMDELSEAVITLPGAFGTMEEITEMITGKQLGFHSKPLVILNINGYYDPLKILFDRFFNENFARSEYKNLFLMTDDIKEALYYIETYKHEEVKDKYKEFNKIDN